MTALEFRTLLLKLDISQMGAARLLGVDPRTVRAWALDERPAPELAGRFLRLLVQAKISPDDALAHLRAERDAREAPRASRASRRRAST